MMVTMTIRQFHQNAVTCEGEVSSPKSNDFSTHLRIVKVNFYL